MFETDFFNNVVSIEKKSDSRSDLSLCLLRLNTGKTAVCREDLFIDIPADIVCAELAADLECIGILLFQSCDLVCGNVVDELPVAVPFLKFVSMLLASSER